MQPFLIQDKNSNYFAVLAQHSGEFLIANKKTFELSWINSHQIVTEYAFVRTD